MSKISSSNVYQIIYKTLSIVNEKIIKHGEVVSYILYKMLKTEQLYSDEQLVDYTMLALLHDIGLYKEDNVRNLADFELQNQWKHSIYGFLFLKYLSPMGDKAEIILYHHLDYERYGMIKSQYLHIIECLYLADKIDNLMNMKMKMSDPKYFSKYRDIRFSGKALDLFLKAEAEHHITERLADGTYKDELNVLLSNKAFTEYYKKGFLEMLVYTIDFRSEYTVMHTMATVNFSQQIGRLMCLRGKDMRNIYYGSLLHDLGKMAIPLRILESPGRLSDKEMWVMKAHVRITELILEGEIDDDVLEIAIRHHEKLDGTGYHKGWTDLDLTLTQKIVAVADILSALYGKRSYKDSFNKELIQKLLKKDADNNKISATIVDCVLENYDNIIAEFERQKDETVGLYLNIKEQYVEISKRFEVFN